MSLIKLIKKIAGSRAIRQWAAAAITIITALVFWKYFAAHPQYLKAISRINVSTVAAILACNAGVVAALVFIYTYTLRLCGHAMPLREQFLLTAYTSLTNFFGPFQSGPGVRAAYLRAKKGVPLRAYFLATLVGYGIFAVLSAAMLVLGAARWWQALLVLLVISGLAGAGGAMYSRSERLNGVRLQKTGGALLGLVAATVVQVIFVTGYYFVELRTVDPSLPLHQIISYTGGANLALFAAITPDAIGIREAFLVASQSLHHISTQTILAANLIDRAVYALFLVLLFGVVAALHAKRRLKLI